MFSWHQNLKITLKLRLAFASLAAMAVLVGGVGLWTMSQLNGRVDKAYKQDLPALAAIKDAGLSQLKAMRILLWIALAAGDSGEITRQNTHLIQSLAEVRKQVTLCSVKLSSKEGREQLATAQKLIPGFEKCATEIVKEANIGDVIGFRHTILEILPINDQIQHSFGQVSLITESQAGVSELLATVTYWGSLTLMIPMVLFAVLLATLMSLLMSSVIARPLARMVNILELVAQGDLTQSLPESNSNENGQVGRSLNRALAALRATLRRVRSSAQDLKSASDSLSAAAITLADGTATQSANLESTTSSLEQISANIRSNADHTSRANQLGKSAIEAAAKGDSAVVAAMTAMDEIKDSSEQITTILSAIEELAFQSNLLAINASIEAAHAGDNGRSFVVIATEMRYLADHSKNAGRDIERLIDTSLDRINRGEKLVKQSGQALVDITASVRNLSTTVREIDSACSKQSEGVENVADAMTTVDSVLQTNISRSLGLSATALQLSTLASDLNAMLSHFTFEGRQQKREVYKEEWQDSGKFIRAWLSRFQWAKRFQFDHVRK